MPGPTSYALLGARPTDQEITITAPLSGPLLVGSLARGDEVEIGLPEEYRTAVVETFRSVLDGAGCEVPVAAYGHTGSSIMAFRRLAFFLAEALTGEVLDGDDDAVWEAWGRSASAWRQAGP